LPGTGTAKTLIDEGQVNLVNAPRLAKQLGIQITESTVALATNCTELIEVSVIKDS